MEIELPSEEKKLTRLKTNLEIERTPKQSDLTRVDSIDDVTIFGKSATKKLVAWNLFFLYIFPYTIAAIYLQSYGRLAVSMNITCFDNMDESEGSCDFGKLLFIIQQEAISGLLPHLIF